MKYRVRHINSYHDPHFEAEYSRLGIFWKSVEFASSFVPEHYDTVEKAKTVIEKDSRWRSSKYSEIVFEKVV